MSAGSDSASTLQPRLGPAWRSTSQGGRGFQPPSASQEAGGDAKNSNRNSFSLLDMDDDGLPKKNESSQGVVPGSPKKFSSRSEGLRSAGIGGGGFGSRATASKGPSTSGGGRSLSDLVSRFPTSASTGRLRGEVRSGLGDDLAASTNRGGSTTRDFVDDKKVIRFTREKLLSMRPRTDPNAVRPDVLNVLDGLPLLSKDPIDPVCWDNFDADEIWSQARERRPVKAQSTGIPAPIPGRRELEQPDHRSSSRGRDDANRWQRGVALPPAGESARREGGGRYESDDPDDLWDDPKSLTEAAADFSAFGGSLDDDPKSASDNAFDLATMAEAAKTFENEVRVTSNGNVKTPDNIDHAVNPKRPLAGVGTTIRSGSGDNVNVFEDFANPGTSDKNEAIRSGGDSQSASSRLMQMIGVSSGDEKAVENTADEAKINSTTSNVFPGFAASAVPSNPWGAPMPSSDPEPSSGGLDLAAKMREAESQNTEFELRRKEEEEEKRRAGMLAQQEQAELQSRQATMQSQQKSQQQPEYSQVELILCERISTILETAWGRSDLLTVLQTLHSDDARVVPLLGTVDALRALTVRHPRRFALTKDPTFGADMVVLVADTAQWQQQKASEDLQRRQQEEHQKMIAAKEAQARAKAEAQARASEPILVTDAPWYYADPQGNVQGPFKGNEMRQWLEAGYFKGDLPISQNQNGGFRKLSSLFPDLSVAFKPTGPSQEEKAQIADLEAKVTAEANAKAEALARADREREEREREAARLAETQNSQNQSTQLKMLLGLGVGGSSDVAGVEGNHVQEVSDVVEPADIVETVPQSRPTKAKNETSAKAEKSSLPPPAWGGAGTSSIQKKKSSMSEIQQEEARVAAQLGKQRGSSGKGSGGGWAGIAASGGTTAWTGAAVKAAPASSTTGMAANSTQQTRGNQQGSNAQKQANSRSSTQKTLEEFGADDKMTPDLENWCKQQMKKLNGSEDLTLVAFCMTLTDPMEIKQYLTAYLGSTTQVSNFAHEFISRKNGTNQQEQWETTGGSKKGRKKKGAK